MQTTAIGGHAEAVACDYLERHGFEVVDRNWRRRDCEIDIVAVKDTTAYFVEVKYRHDDFAGHGLDYITRQKLLRMSHAAERWVQIRGWRGQYVLSAVEVTGNYVVSAFVESVT